jgi:hypothetical protein
MRGSGVRHLARISARQAPGTEPWRARSSRAGSRERQAGLSRRRDPGAPRSAEPSAARYLSGEARTYPSPLARRQEEALPRRFPGARLEPRCRESRSRDRAAAGRACTPVPGAWSHCRRGRPAHGRQGDGPVMCRDRRRWLARFPASRARRGLSLGRPQRWPRWERDGLARSPCSRRACTPARAATRPSTADATDAPRGGPAASRNETRS